MNDIYITFNYVVIMVIHDTDNKKIHGDVQWYLQFIKNELSI